MYFPLYPNNNNIFPSIISTSGKISGEVPIFLNPIIFSPYTFIPYWIILVHTILYWHNPIISIHIYK